MDHIVIPSHIYKDMLEHCGNCLPDEACGILAGSGSVVSELYPITNIEASPVSYLMDPAGQFRAMKDMRARGLSMTAIFHSHPASPPFPSAKDTATAFYDDAVYVIVGLAEGPSPSVRAFSFREGKVEETGIAIKQTD